MPLGWLGQFLDVEQGVSLCLAVSCWGQAPELGTQLLEVAGGALQRVVHRADSLWASFVTLLDFDRDIFGVHRRQLLVGRLPLIR